MKNNLLFLILAHFCDLFIFTVIYFSRQTSKDADNLEVDSTKVVLTNFIALPITFSCTYSLLLNKRINTPRYVNVLIFFIYIARFKLTNYHNMHRLYTYHIRIFSKAQYYIIYCLIKHLTFSEFFGISYKNILD